SEKSPTVDGRQVLVRNFDANFARDPRIFVIGEDVGRLGDVNLVFEGLQAKHGELRLTDTGIREATILGQAIGSAMRGLRPICDIQYLDYFYYALETATDDLATLHWRTVGGQKAPVVIRTKGHRLVGIWHSGSPMSVLLNALQGIYVCVPRNMTQAAGFYNTLFRGDNPGLVVEVLNGYRLKTHVLVGVGDEVPGGASAFMLQQGLEKQGGWWHLDAAPRTLAASPNRPAYGPDGDYFSKPNRQSIVEAVYEVVRERQPWRFPA